MHLDEMQGRVLRLEKQNRRFSRIAIGLLMAIASAVLVGHTPASQRNASPEKSAPKSASISLRLSRLESRVDALSKIANILLVAQGKSDNGSAASSDVDDLSSQVSDLDDKLKNVSDDVDSLKSDVSDVSDLKSHFDDFKSDVDGLKSFQKAVCAILSASDSSSVYLALHSGVPPACPVF